MTEDKSVASKVGPKRVPSKAKRSGRKPATTTRTAVRKTSRTVAPQLDSENVHFGRSRAEAPGAVLSKHQTTRVQFEATWASIGQKIDLLTATEELLRARDCEEADPELVDVLKLREDMDCVMARAAEAASRVLRRALTKWERAVQWALAQQIATAVWSGDQPSDTMLGVLARRVGVTREELKMAIDAQATERKLSGAAKAAARVVGAVMACHPSTVEKATLSGPFFRQYARAKHEGDTLRSKGSLTELALRIGMTPPIPRRRTDSKK